MRMTTRIIYAGVLTLGLAAAAAFAPLAFAPSAFAQEAKPTQDDAKALTLKAVDLIVAKGLDAARTELNVKGGPWYHGSLYVNVIDLNGVWLVYPPNPSGVGQNMSHIKDPDGKFLVQDIVALGKDKGEGWTEYRWKNPESNKIEPKITFVKRVPGQDMIAYSGVYK